jgi:hypothetical protein
MHVSTHDDDRAARLSPIGRQRLRVLDCLGGNFRFAPGYFSPLPGVDIHEAFARHVVDLSARWAGETDRLTITLLAAARLLIGDKSAARTIVDRLPPAPPRLDHGAGFCLIAAQQVLAAVLPLPAELADIQRWLAGSPEQGALRAWVDQHQDRLLWDQDAAVYKLAGATSAPLR